MNKINPTRTDEHLEKLRERKAKKQELASKKQMENTTTPGKVPSPPILFKIKNIRSIRKASTILMEDMMNKAGRFSNAESRTFKDLCDVYFKSTEQITVHKALKQLQQEQRAQGE